ncbi:MAG: cytochrome c oxidase subunit II [Betaproteobacteria bacterium]|nr:cytochrome c oxidase subunit II [Betaproteobacteria bacterium]
MNRLRRPAKAGFAALAACLSAQAFGGWTLPEAVTPVAEDTAHVHNLFMLIASTLFFVVLALVLYSVFTHRKSKGFKAATFTGPKGGKQVFFTLAPFAGLLFIDYVIFGIPAYHAVLAYEDTKTNADMVVKVTGSQWKWQYEYPADNVKFVSVLTTPQEQIHNQQPKGENYLLEVDNAVVLPVGKKIRFITTSTDVIHSWWVPAFGVKRDAIPGFLREFWATIEKPGIYRGQCAELCGKDHGFMPVVVKAVPEEEFRKWIDEQKAVQVAAAESAGKEWTKDELMAHGKEVYEKTCAACHKPDGSGMPPAFPALAGSKIATGPYVDSDGHLVKDGHLDRVLNGKTGTAMQAFRETLSDADIASVVTYERNSFGNKTGDAVQPAVVKKMR